ncbi:MAG TPA: hypothetical protein VK760_08335 [Candidatus Acidoferrales bacterium]|nr:hypothetical protein [Candidatus Acidoferrales bacterium]
MRPIIRFTTIAAALALVAFAACTAAEPDSATIVNSGSTNFTGYTIDVRSDGGASAQASNPGAEAESTPKPFTIDAATAKQFFADLAAARSDRAAVEPCMKSASFGSTTHVTWRGWTSPDLSCPPGNAAGAALVHDVQTITAASGVSTGPRRGGGPPRRQPQPEPSPAPS